MDKEKTIEQFKSVRCPICGKLPKIRALCGDGDRRPGDRSDTWNEYKVSCPGHHLDCGDWKDTEEKAWKDWERRTKDTTQPDFCFNENMFAIQKMSLGELADFLYRWQKNAVGVMCRDFKTGCAFSCTHNEECGEHLAGVPTENTIRKWLEKPVDGLYPKGYPGVPEEQQSKDLDIYGYRKRQAEHKI